VPDAARLLPELQTTNHLVTIPSQQQPRANLFSPQHTHFVVNVIHLRDSLAVWVGLAPREVVERAQAKAKSKASKAGGDKAVEDEGEADALDRELAAAMRQAGRLDDSTGPARRHGDEQQQAKPPCGALAIEWAVAMTQPSHLPNKRTAPLATSLFRTNADVALPMSQRLAVRLGQTQLFLSLDLPPSLVAHATAMVPAPPERSATLLLLERGIADAIRTGLKTVHARRERASGNA